MSATLKLFAAWLCHDQAGRPGCFVKSCTWPLSGVPQYLPVSHLTQALSMKFTQQLCVKAAA